jgi:hypothetical protein
MRQTPIDVSGFFQEKEALSIIFQAYLAHGFGN